MKIKPLIIFIAVACFLTYISQNAITASVIKEWNFTDRATMNEWKTSFIWEQKNSRQGIVEWSSSFGGSARLYVSGSPCVINIWRTLPFNLEWGDLIRVEFSTKSSLHPISGFDLIVGPAEPYGHKQSLQVSVESAGSYTITIPIYYYWAVKGTPFGLHFAVWPGTAELYITKIIILR